MPEFAGSLDLLFACTGSRLSTNRFRKESGRIAFHTRGNPCKRPATRKSTARGGAICITDAAALVFHNYRPCVGTAVIK